MTSMIRANGDKQYLPLYEALASEVRWRIMSLLAGQEMNMKEIASRLELSPSIVTMHIRKLEQAGLLGSRRVRLNGGRTSCVFSRKSILRSSCRRRTAIRGSGSRVFLSAIIPRLRCIRPAGSVPVRWRSGCGMIRATSMTPSG